jgi:hypothetical protein
LDDESNAASTNRLVLYWLIIPTEIEGGGLRCPFLYVEKLRLFVRTGSSRKGENYMNKLISIMWLLLVAASISACTESPIKAGNTADQQRSNARDAQDELSTEVHR